MSAGISYLFKITWNYPAQLISNKNLGKLTPQKIQLKTYWEVIENIKRTKKHGWWNTRMS